MSPHIHIICFDIPYPPSYGGAIDVFYRIKALHDKGVRITLHCYYKEDKGDTSPLEALCEQVYYYPRKTTIWQQFSWHPYSVESRNAPDLLTRLLQDNSPILFEGLVSCALMAHPALSNRKKFFRECNVEHEYYRALGKASSSVWKKCFFYIEALRLKYFERCLVHADGIMTLAHQDEMHFKTRYPSVETLYIPCFHAYDKVTASFEQADPYILYHGNLSVAENHKAAMHIVQHLAPHIPYPIIIAGYKPQDSLRKAIARNDRITLIDSPDTPTMNRLIRDAQVHLLITFQSTGIKLKLLNVLYTGKHVVVNPPMLVGTDLSSLCHVGHTDEELIALCNSLMQDPFRPSDSEKRQEVLEHSYNNLSSAQRIVEQIFKAK